MSILEAKLQGVKSVALAGHINPDGDCIGSLLSVYNYIENKYPDIEISAYLEEAGEKFDFLKNSEHIKHSIDTAKHFDLLICVDAADKERLGFAKGLLDNCTASLAIDHHISHKRYADDLYLVGEASSTAEIIYELLDEEFIDKSVAECIYTGIVHDTGVFRYPATSSSTLDIAGKLIDKGIDFSTILEESFFKKSYRQNQILGRALLESILILDGKVIFSHISRKLMDFYGVSNSDLGGIVELLRQTEGVEVAIFLYEMDTQVYKVNLRSKRIVDVSKIATHFGGGGHLRAAGVNMNGTVHDIVNNISLHIEDQLIMAGKEIRCKSGR